MANLLVYPRFKAFDVDGTVLAYGKVHTYITNTTTPKATYTNAEAGTENDNPVILDAHGEADIWGDTDSQYTLVVTDADDAVISTIDHISPIQDPSTLTSDLDTNGHKIISTGSNDIELDPASGRHIILNNVKWPGTGTTNYFLKLSDANTAVWAAQTTDIVGDTSPQLGGNLDTNSYNIICDDLTGILDSNSNELLIFNTVASAVNFIDITNAATGNAPSLKANGSDVNADVHVSGKGTGAVVISGLRYPVTDSLTAGDCIVTDAAGNLSFSSSTGALVNREVTKVLTVSTLTTQIPLDDTKPQNTEGDLIASVTITPSLSTNRLKISAVIPFASVSGATTVSAAIFQDSTADALNASAVYFASTSHRLPIIVEWEMAAGTTSATTFKLRAGPSSGVTAYTLAGSSGTRHFGGVAAVSLTVDELIP